MRPIGYLRLIEEFALKVTAPPIRSFLKEKGSHETIKANGQREERYPPQLRVGTKWTDHLEFALRREGVNLEVLSGIFHRASEQELTEWIQTAPKGKHSRIAWFLAEWILGRRLPLEDIGQANYVPVLNGDAYFVLRRDAAEQSTRHKVINNLPGTPAYCPLVRKTGNLLQGEQKNLDALASEEVRRYPEAMLFRATQYLYLKETKSSYEIERERPDRKRMTGFVTLLRQAREMDAFAVESLITVQNAIVDPRYQARKLRDFQNYVGQTISPGRELVHFVPPRPEDLDFLVNGWLETCRKLQRANVHPVIIATIAGFGFVFLHPFEDGNGRLHRFLIHHALAVGGFVPPGGIFPVSATMLKQRGAYEATLEAYSREVGKIVEYQMNDRAELRVTNGFHDCYRFPDFTVQAEALFKFVEDTIRLELIPELETLMAYDEARVALLEVVDLPERRLELLVRLVIQGNGNLSKAKRDQFAELSDEELGALEQIIRDRLLVHRDQLLQ